MNSYKSLRTISDIFQVLAWINLVLGVVITVAFLSTLPISSLSLLYIIGGILLTAIAFIVNMAISQLIMLFVNSADNIQNIKHNLYTLALKIDDNLKSQSPIEDEEL